MPLELSRPQAAKIKSKLMNAPVAPGDLAPLINVGTQRMLDVLDEQYFRKDLADGISSFKYVEGDYGSGKTQFIQCLATRAHARQIVTAIVSIGQECPFNSTHAIFSNILTSLEAPSSGFDASRRRGIELLLESWVHEQLRKHGITPGDSVPDQVAHEIARPFNKAWLGAPDAQMGFALMGLARRVVAWSTGAAQSGTDRDLISWVRGDKIRSKTLRDEYSLNEPTTDVTAFPRLKTAISFLRERLGYKGVFIAFDEGTRVMSFRRGTAKQRQAVENMLTMINQNADGEFGGVMFLYAATPEFRTDVIRSTYIALNDRIGSVAFVPGQPITPLILLDQVNSDETTLELANRLLDVFEKADGTSWDRSLQLANARVLIDAQKRKLGFVNSVPPRYFVYHWCRVLAVQQNSQTALEQASALAFIEGNPLPSDGE